ncbi:MAG TPA: ammonium transporter [Firmicutes bacterium]|nr:ammonium transporter [Bacillota bacterium]
MNHAESQPGLRHKAATLALLACVTLVLGYVSLGHTGDPSGASTGGINDVAAQVPGAPTFVELANQVGRNKLGLNFVWTLLAGFLVFFMQAGFALVETGFTRAKNAAHTMTMNFMVFLVGAVGYYLVGFALQFGGIMSVPNLGGVGPLNGEFAPGGLGLFGYKGFALGGAAYDVGVFALFLFQMVFMDTAATIPTGAMAERVKFLAVVASTLFISMILYPLYGNWVWGGGWLAGLGARFGLGHGVVDFAGSGVVHMIGGMAALAGAKVLGPRIGKFREDGTPLPIPGHNIPLAVLGTIILFFGWFGFNPGSTLAGGDLRISVVAVNTMMAGAVGGLAAMVYTWVRSGKPDPGMICNGSLAGLVAITAPCAFVNAASACLIGLVAGILVVAGAQFIEHKLKIDDPVGAIAVHGLNGLWGLLSLGIFADGTYGAGWNGVGAQIYQGIPGRGIAGLLYGDPGQFMAQLIGGGVAIVWGFGLSYAFFKLLDWVFGIRTSAADEMAGLDIPEMGVMAYPDFVLPQSVPTEPDDSGSAGSRLSRPVWKPVPQPAEVGVTGPK